MQDSKFGKVISKILPFVLLLGICVAIAFIFGTIADKQLEKKAQEEQAQTENTDIGEATVEYGVFLDAGPEEAAVFSEYDTVVIDAQYYTAEDIATLRNSGITTLYSYLNVGSLEQFRDYYFSYEQFTLDEYEKWNDEKWVNVSAPEWAEFINGLADELLAKGVDGFFVDNCDVYYQYKEEKIYNGLTGILKALKDKGCTVIVNGGDVFVSETISRGMALGEYFDGVNQESVYTSVVFDNVESTDAAEDVEAIENADADENTNTVNCSNVIYEKSADEDRAYFTEYLDTVAAAGGAVYVIEYSNTEQLTQEALEYSKAHNWTVYVANGIELDAAKRDNDSYVPTEVVEPEPAEPTEEELLEAKIDEWLTTHSLEDKVAQLFVITPEALTTNGKTVTALNDSLSEGINNCSVGGFIFFSRNLKNRDQTIAMLGEIAGAYEQIDMPVPFLAVDEEGGLVARIGNNPAFDVESTVPMSQIGATGDVNYAYQVGSYIGSYLFELGFNMNMAPDADVLSNPSNTVIGDRSFGSDSELVAEMVIAESQALSEQNIIFAVKHFPGHGSTEADSHNGYAYTDKTLDELYECELIPFQKAIDAGIGVIMVGHISVPNITDDDVPSSLSEYMITGILRKAMGFNGIVITDAMNMGAVTKQYSSAEAAVLAIQAGADIILMPEDFYAAYNGVIEAVNDGYITEERIEESVRRILREKWQ